MIKFIYFQHHEAVGMSCFAAPRSPPAPPSALCGTAERVSAVRAGGASRTFCGAREGARGRGAQGAVAYPADSHAPARGEPRRGAPPPRDCTHQRSRQVGSAVAAAGSQLARCPLLAHTVRGKGRRGSAGAHGAGAREARACCAAARRSPKMRAQRPLVFCEI